MVKFGERYAGIDNSNFLQTDGIDRRLKNKIWSAICIAFFDQFFIEGFDKDEFSVEIYVNFFGLAKDDISCSREYFQNQIKNRYYDLEWFQVYEIIEFLACRKQYFFPDGYNGSHSRKVFCAGYFGIKINEYLKNEYLKAEKSGYRLKEKTLIKITDEYELEAIGEALKLSDRFLGARKHLKQAAEHYSSRETPDYRNSIKESISAVESVYRIMSGKTHKTIGEAIKDMEAHGLVIPTALKLGFSHIYGWTSNEEGLRHAILDGKVEASENDAKLMLVLCSGYVNYLVARSVELIGSQKT